MESEMSTKIRQIHQLGLDPDFFLRLEEERKESVQLLADLSARYKLEKRTDYCDQLREPPQFTECRLKIKFRAEQLHSKYPQYAGHWDNWKLGRFIRHSPGKHGTVFGEVGDYCLVKPTATWFELQGGSGFCATVFSLRQNGDVSAEIGKVEVL